MIVVALPFRVTAKVSGEIEDAFAGEFVLSQAHSVPQIICTPSVGSTFDVAPKETPLSGENKSIG